MTIPLVLVLLYGEFHQGPETLEAFLLPAALSLFLGIFLQMFAELSIPHPISQIPHRLSPFCLPLAVYHLPFTI
jgi:hypothetical protein